METIGDISVWLTPVIIIGLFLWLRADIRLLGGWIEKRFDGLEGRIEKCFDGMEKRFDGMDERMQALEAGQAEIRVQLSVICEYIVRPNLREPEGAPEAAPGN